MGKEHCLDILSKLPIQHQTSLPYRTLVDHLRQASSFSIILGYDASHLYWEDVRSNAPIETIRATAIAREFA